MFEDCSVHHAQAGAPPQASHADANHNGIPDGYEFAQTADFYNHREWRQRGVPMAALLGTSSADFHPAEREQVRECNHEAYLTHRVLFQ